MKDRCARGTLPPAAAPYPRCARALSADPPGAKPDRRTTHRTAPRTRGAPRRSSLAHERTTPAGPAARCESRPDRCDRSGGEHRRRARAPRANLPGPPLPRSRACWSPLHPWIVGGVGVHARAAVTDGFGAQLVVPEFVAVDLAQPVRGAVLGQPRRRSGRRDVDGIPRHVHRPVRRGDPASGFLFGAVLRYRLTEELFLVLGRTPAAVDVELDPLTCSIRGGRAEGPEQSGVKSGDGRILVIEDRHAVGDHTVSLAECTLLVGGQ